MTPPTSREDSADLRARFSSGRKPVLIIGLTGVTVSIVAFGFGKSFWMLVASRCFGGALNGNVA